MQGFYLKIIFMKIKVCGMRDRENIEHLVGLKPDFIGFIFYPQSKRYAGDRINDEIIDQIPGTINKVGVFVDESMESILEKYHLNRLDLLQLHGNETPDYCQKLKELDISVIKAFSITHDFDFRSIHAYEFSCDYFLFDTAGKTAGGTGIKFDWNILNQYKGGTPFFLSGGIGPSDKESILSISHHLLTGIDINSGFETAPGQKDIGKLEPFINSIRATTFH